jgi:hypothetical protein
MKYRVVTDGGVIVGLYEAVEDALPNGEIVIESAD